MNMLSSIKYLLKIKKAESMDHEINDVENGNLRVEGKNPLQCIGD
jgi:hypothetical protein